MTDIARIQKKVHELAKEKGFWDHKEPTLSTDIVLAKLALIHSEISEAVEEVRDGRTEVIRIADDYSKPEGIAIELADAVIRILDLAERLGIDMESAISCKHQYNKGRPYKHGRKA